MDGFPKKRKECAKGGAVWGRFSEKFAKRAQIPAEIPQLHGSLWKTAELWRSGFSVFAGQRIGAEQREYPLTREKLPGLANGRRILYDQNERIRPYKPDHNDRSEAAHMKKLRAFGLALIVVLSLSGCGALEEGKGGCPPTITLGDQDYVAHNMPVEALPEEYQYLRDLTQQEANDTGLEGCAIYADPQDQDMSTIYLYQECGTPIDENTVDTEQRQWAYVQWVSSGERDETSDPAATEDAGRS